MLPQPVNISDVPFSSLPLLRHPGQLSGGGATWNDWHPKVRELLLSKQNGDGSWDVPPGTAESNKGDVGPNKVYWTAMATLVFEIYMHFLPAHQR